MNAFAKTGRIAIIIVIIVAGAASSFSQIWICCILVVERGVLERNALERILLESNVLEMICSIARISRKSPRLLSPTYLSIINGRGGGYAFCAAMMSLMCIDSSVLLHVAFFAPFNMPCL